MQRNTLKLPFSHTIKHNSGGKNWKHFEINSKNFYSFLREKILPEIYGFVLKKQMDH